MIDTVFLLVPRSTDGAGSAEMARIVDDVKDHTFNNYDEVSGFVIGRCYGQGKLYSVDDLAAAHNREDRKLSESLIFALRYECDED